MDKKIVITCENFPGLRLLSALDADQEKLRIWKNNHRSSFFYQENIQPDQQLKWFQGYLNRADDYMFMVEEDGYRIGCMAFRAEDEDIIDLYNIIRGEAGEGKVTMRDAMCVMLAYIKTAFPERRIKCDVLKDNPAVKWYQKCGFSILEEKEYYIMGIQKEDISALMIDSKEEIL
ncbi:MAG: GNAT family N-acetyltransferase [Lachnospiraceae bacterium]|nr:GNAT family N-acetyltransferase [Lachnospiraceae bacterium]